MQTVAGPPEAGRIDGTPQLYHHSSCQAAQPGTQLKDRDMGGHYLRLKDRGMGGHYLRLKNRGMGTI